MMSSRKDGEDMGTKKDGGMTGRKNIGMRQRATGAQTAGV